MAHPDTVVIEQLEEALLDLQPGDPERNNLMLKLAFAFHVRYYRTRALEDIETSIRQYRELEASETDMALEDNQMVIHNLAHSYRAKAIHTGILADIDPWIKYVYMSLDFTSAPEKKLQLLEALGDAYSRKFGRAHELANLDASIAKYKQMAGHDPTKDRAGLESLLEEREMLDSLYTQLPSGAAQQIAVDNDSNGEQTTKCSSNMPGLASKVWRTTAYVAYETFQETSSIADLEQAIKYLGKSVGRASIENSDQLKEVWDKANLESWRYMATEDAGALDKAISHFKETIEKTTNSWQLCGALQSTAYMCYKKFQATQDASWLQQAMYHLDTALQVAEDDDPGRATVLRNLGKGHLILYLLVGHPDDLEVSSQRLEQAAAIKTPAQGSAMALRAPTRLGDNIIFSLQIDELPNADPQVLHAACQRGHSDIVRKQIKKGTDVNFHGPHDATPLMRTIGNGHLETVAVLFECGAALHEKSKIGTALHVAAATGDIGAAEMLINSGAEINSSLGARVETPLHAASRESGKDMVLFLLDKGADIHATDVGGWTALHHAAAIGNREVVQLLTSRGLDVNQPDAKGIVPLLMAGRVMHEDTVLFLCDNGAHVNACVNGAPLLSLAANAQDAEFVNIILKYGADANARDAAGETPLHTAARHGHADILRALLQGGSDMALRDPFGRTPLFHACLKGQKVTTRLLLRQGGSCTDIKDHYGQTALSIAARHGFTPLVTRLINSGADLTTIDMFGRNSLWWASSQGYNDTVEVLLTAGQRTRVRLLKDDKLAEANPRDGDSAVVCNVCTLRVHQASGYHHCDLCLLPESGGLDICSECLALGAHCLDAEHALQGRV